MYTKSLSVATLLLLVHFAVGVPNICSSTSLLSCFPGGGGINNNIRIVVNGRDDGSREVVRPVRPVKPDHVVVPDNCKSNCYNEITKQIIFFILFIYYIFITYLLFTYLLFTYLLLMYCVI